MLKVVFSLSAILVFGIAQAEPISRRMSTADSSQVICHNRYDLRVNVESVEWGGAKRRRPGGPEVSLSVNGARDMSGQPRVSSGVVESRGTAPRKNGPVALDCSSSVRFD